MLYQIGTTIIKKKVSGHRGQFKHIDITKKTFLLYYIDITNTYYASHPSSLLIPNLPLPAFFNPFSSH